MKTLHIIILLILLITVSFILSFTSSPTPLENKTVKDCELYVRNESNRMFKEIVKKTGLNKFYHMTKIDNSVIRMNLDTLYSFSVIDLKSSPIVKIKHDENIGYSSLAVIDQDHYTVYTSSLEKDFEKVFNKKDYPNNDYLLILVRISNTESTQDIEDYRTGFSIIELNKIHTPVFNIPPIDMKKHKKQAENINNIFKNHKSFSSKNAFGSKDTVDPLNHVIGTQHGYGGLPKEMAVYETFDLNTKDFDEFSITLPPNLYKENGFWSITVYNKDGFYDEGGKHYLNSFMYEDEYDPKDEVIIYFSNEYKELINHIETTPGCNFTLRVYNPNDSIIHSKENIIKTITNIK